MLHSKYIRGIPAAFLFAFLDARTVFGSILLARMSSVFTFQLDFRRYLGSNQTAVVGLWHSKCILNITIAF